MAITAANLFFFESERMIESPSSVDTIGGGGLQGTVIVQDGVENNVFPDVMPGDFIEGKVQYRKVYAAVLSNDRDPLTNTRVGLAALTTDPQVDVCFLDYSYGSRGAGVTVGDVTPMVSGDIVLAETIQAIPDTWDGAAFVGGDWAAGDTVIDGFASTASFSVGDPVVLKSQRLGQTTVEYQKNRYVVSKTSTALTLSGTVTPAGGEGTWRVRGYEELTTVGPVYSSTNYNYLTAWFDCAFANNSAVATGISDTSDSGFGTALSGGYSVGVQVEAPDGTRAYYGYVSKTASTVTLDDVAYKTDASPGAYPRKKTTLVNGANVIAAGVDGIARSMATTTASSTAGATVMTVDDLLFRTHPNGTLTLSSEDYYSTTGNWQKFFPGDRVLIQHATTSVREFAIVSRVNYQDEQITFTAALANAYASGSKVSMSVDLGTLQAASSITPFSQQAWTRSWSDAIIGSAISARYSGTIGLTNEGAITDRWAVVFTNATQFSLISERLGTIATGNIGSDFLPLNPTTNEPYMTLYATSWGLGWITGNVLRFNTQAAAAPIWVLRCISPGSASGTDQATLFIHGDVNA